MFYSFIIFVRSVDRDKRFDEKNEENISNDMVLHTFVSFEYARNTFNSFYDNSNNFCFQFTDDERVNNKKRKMKDARIVFEVLLKESNTQWEQDLPPKKKPESLFNVTKVIVFWLHFLTYILERWRSRHNEQPHSNGSEN